MSKYGTTNAAPAIPFVEGDSRFTSMNLKQDRSQLPVGVYHSATNKRTGRGFAETRDGTITPVFANIYTFFKIYGSGLYSNPNGREVILVAMSHQEDDLSFTQSVQMIHSGSLPATVIVPQGTFDDVDKVEFSQDFNAVQMHRSNADLDDFPRMSWDGFSVEGFTVVTKASTDPTKEVVPGVEWSINIADRDVFPLSSDTIGASLIGDYTEYDSILAVFRVNSGTADPIVGAYPYQQGNILVGKRRSWDVLNNFSGDLSQVSAQIVSTEIGLLARKSAKMVGSDLIFLYDTGVYRISQIVLSTISAGEVPISDPIEPLIRRINLAYADKAVAAVLGYYYFLAVPLDNSTFNNAVLVYNTVTGGWEAFDLWNEDSGMRIDNLIVTEYEGSQHLYAINHDGPAIHVLYTESATSDTTHLGEFQIQSTLETRGYALVAGLGYLFDSRGAAELGAQERASIVKSAKNVAIGVRTWNPSMMISQIDEGAFDERTLNDASITRNRLLYRTFGREDYDPSNVNNDASVPGREDYSVPLSQPIFFGDGINLGQKQEEIIRFVMNSRTRWASFKIDNTQGQCDIMGILFETKGLQRDIRRLG